MYDGDACTSSPYSESGKKVKKGTAENNDSLFYFERSLEVVYKPII